MRVDVNSFVAAVVDLGQQGLTDTGVDAVKRFGTEIPDAVPEDHLAGRLGNHRVEFGDRIGRFLLRLVEAPLTEKAVLLRRHWRRLQEQRAVALDVAADLLLQLALVLHEGAIVL
jgi:hypothetical protein